MENLRSKIESKIIAFHEKVSAKDLSVMIVELIEKERYFYHEKCPSCGSDKKRAKMRGIKHYCANCNFLY